MVLESHVNPQSQTPTTYLYLPPAHLRFSLLFSTASYCTTKEKKHSPVKLFFAFQWLKLEVKVISSPSVTLGFVESKSLNFFYFEFH